MVIFFSTMISKAFYLETTIEIKMYLTKQANVLITSVADFWQMYVVRKMLCSILLYNGGPYMSIPT